MSASSIDPVSVVLPGGWLVRSRADLEPGAIDVQGGGHGRIVLVSGDREPYVRILHAMLSDSLASVAGSAAPSVGSSSAGAAVRRDPVDIVVAALGVSRAEAYSLMSESVRAWVGEADASGSAPDRAATSVF